MGTLVVVAILLLALFGAPLFVIMSTAALFSLYFVADINPAVAIAEIYRLASAPTLLAIPLFTFAGYLLAESKAPERLVRLNRALFGSMPGGLALVTLVACAIFTSLTGASGVTIIALGGLLYPALMKDRYDERFSLGLLTSCGSLGLLFLPSLPLILYGLVASVNVDKLFLAGLIPGILLIVLLGIYSVLIGKKTNVARQKFQVKEALLSIKHAAWELPLPVIVIGGIFSGIITVSEAAAATAFYVFIIHLFIYRDVRFRDLPKIMKESMVLVGAIIVILGCALGFTNFLIDQLVPQKALAYLQTHIHSKFTFLIMLNIFLLIVGCLMDMFSAIVVVVPLIVPIATSFGVDPVHLGIIFLTNLEIGYLTPPVGINLFIASSRFNKPVVTLYTASIPFLIVLLIGLIIITYWPDLSLTLPSLSGVQ